MYYQTVARRRRTTMVRWVGRGTKEGGERHISIGKAFWED